MPTIPIIWTDFVNASINGDGNLEKDAGGDECFLNASGSGDAGARSQQEIVSGDFEFRCVMGENDGSGLCGRSFAGISTGALSLNFGDWQAATHVSTEANTSGTPHPAKSIFAYQGPAPNKTYRDGLWVPGTRLSIRWSNGRLRAYINSLLFYVYAGAVTYPIHAAVSLACLNKTIEDAEFIIGDGSTPSPCEIGSDIAVDDCAAGWIIPVPDPLPLPANGGPRPKLFQEIDGDWGEHGNTFADGKPAYNTIQTDPIRLFNVVYEVDQDKAAILDAHKLSTRGGLAFTVTHPYTGEVITNCRYRSYDKDSHNKVWAQTRRMQLIRYTS